jgi:hypothetical protein
MVFIWPDLVECLKLEQFPLPQPELISVTIDTQEPNSHTLHQITTLPAQYHFHLDYIDCHNCTEPLYAHYPGASFPL